MEMAVFGLASNRDHAERIISKLQQAGFAPEEISVLLSDKEGRDLHETSATGVPRNSKKGILSTEKHTKAPEGGVTGAITGGIVGGSIGLLAGIGAIAIPGLGAFIAAGPLLALLSGTAVGGAVGLLVGALAGFGIPEYEAKKYESGLRSGNVLICVHASDFNHVDSAKRALKKEGATDIATSREKAGSSS